MSRRGESGFALVTAMVLMAMMLIAGAALAATIDVQTRESRVERVRDGAFNLAESALNAQLFALSRDWPGPGRSVAPYGVCTAATPSPRCPDDASLRGGASPDLAGATWETRVRDNGAGSAPDFYSDPSTLTQPGFDANRDGRVWVRAQAVAQGRTRTLVALVRAETQEEDLPHAALIAGSLAISNNGNKELIRSGGGQVSVRCDPLAPAFRLTPCVGHVVTSLLDLNGLLTGRLAAQISGTTPVTKAALAAAMTPEARARLKATAIADGTYYTGCPTAAQLTGRLVYIESGDCSYTANGTYNAPAAPGTLVLGSGSLSLGGTSAFYGVVYNANTGGASAAGVTTQGNAQIVGGVLIDGGAQMVVGSSGLNISFDLNAFRAVASYGAAGIIQNTWREIRAG